MAVLCTSIRNAIEPCSAGIGRASRHHVVEGDVGGVWGCAKSASDEDPYLLDEPDLLPGPSADVGGDSLGHEVQLVGVQARIVLLVLDGQAEQVIAVGVGAGRCRDARDHGDTVTGLREVAPALVLACAWHTGWSEAWPQAMQLTWSLPGRTFMKLPMLDFTMLPSWQQLPARLSACTQAHSLSTSR